MTDKEQYNKDYERYLKIKDKIKNSEDRSFLINFLLEEGRKVLEKENTELKERIKEVENDSNNCEHWSYQRIKGLEQQIEKMKCCENCINCKTGNCTEDNMFYARTTKQCNNWKLAK